MAKELAFALINPYSIAKSRTGGLIGRLVTRTGLELVAARMFGPSAELASKYADHIRNSSDVAKEERPILADYVATHYAPDPKTGKRHRVLMLLLEGEDAINKVKNAVGPLKANSETGETVRDTFGDYIVNPDSTIRYVEPAVMVGRSPESVAASLKLWAAYSEKDGGMIEDAVDVAKGADIERTLVILKPDNFRFPSARVGNIIDIFSASGLRIVCAKVHRMSVAEAEEFYGPVRAILHKKLKDASAERASKVLGAEFAMEIPDTAKSSMGDILGPAVGDHMFYQIIQFMTGYWPPSLADDDKAQPGKERSLILVYSGAKAVDKIRKILGPTDPSKAEPGSVRKEFGKDIMVNAAHASDSTDNAKREMRIVKVEQDLIKQFVEKYYK